MMFLRSKKIGGITARMIIKNMIRVNLLSMDGDFKKKMKMEFLLQTQEIISVMIMIVQLFQMFYTHHHIMCGLRMLYFGRKIF